MNSNYVRKEVAKTLKIKLTEADSTIEAVMTQIATSLLRDGAVKLAGFGTFELRRTALKRIVNPTNGKTKICPPENKVVFVPSPKLKNSL